MFILFIIYRTLNLAFLPIPFTWMYIVNMKNARNYDACKIETFKHKYNISVLFEIFCICILVVVHET